MLFHKVCESHNTRLGFTSHYFQLRHLTLYLSYSSRIRGTCWKSQISPHLLAWISRVVKKPLVFGGFREGFPSSGSVPSCPERIGRERKTAAKPWESQSKDPTLPGFRHCISKFAILSPCFAWVIR